MRETCTECTGVPDGRLRDAAPFYEVSNIRRLRMSISSNLARASVAAVAVFLGSIPVCRLTDVQDPATPRTLAAGQTSFAARSNGDNANAKTDICHRTGGATQFILISVATPAVEAHLAHGDGRLGEAVPGQPGMRFGPNCQAEIAPFHSTIFWSARGMVRDTDHNGFGDEIFLNDPLLLSINGFAVEQRGVLEFSIAQLSRLVGHAELNLVVTGAGGHMPFDVQVYMYAGDGAVTLSDFAAGSFATSFSYAGQTQVTLDVTNALNSLIASHATYAGFNFRAQLPDIITGPHSIVFSAFDYPLGPTPTLEVRTP